MVMAMIGGCASCVCITIYLNIDLGTGSFFYLSVALLISSCIAVILFSIVLVLYVFFASVFHLTMKALHLLKQKENSGLLESHQMNLIQCMSFLLEPAYQNLHSTLEILAMPLLTTL